MSTTRSSGPLRAARWNASGSALVRPDGTLAQSRIGATDRRIQRGAFAFSWGTVASTSHANGGAINADTQFGGTHTAYIPYNAARARVSVGLSAPLDLSGFRSFGVWINSTAAAGRVLRLYVARESGFTNYGSWELFVQPGTNFYILAKGGATTGTLAWAKGGTFDFSDATYFRFLDKTDSSEPGFTNTGLQPGESYTISAITAQPRGRACVLVNTDDGYVYNVRNPTLSRSGFPASGNTFLEIASHYGIRGTAYIIPELIGSSSSFMTQADLQVLLDAGWVLGTHSNAGSGNGLVDLGSQAAVYAEVTTEIARMRAFGFIPDSHIRHFSLPQGGYNYYTQAALDQIPELVTIRATGSTIGTTAVAHTVTGGRHISFHGNLIVARDTGNAVLIRSGQQIDGLATTADHDTYLNALVTEGAVGTCFAHQITGAIATSFDYFCNAAATLRAAGKLDIMTVDEFYRSLS